MPKLSVVSPVALPLAGILARIRNLQADLPPTARRIAAYIEANAEDVIRIRRIRRT